MAPFLEERAPLLAEATGAQVLVDHIRNDFYGEIVTTAGLLAGRDVLAQIGPGASDPVRAGDIVLIPGESLNGDDLFIDSLPLDELQAQLAPAVVRPGMEVTATLRDVAGEVAA